MTPDVVNDKFLEIGGRGTLTTLQSPGYQEGDSSIQLVSPTNWPNGYVVAFSMRRIEISGANAGKEEQGSYTEWVGIINGNSIDSIVKASGVDQPYAPGIQTQVMIHVSSTWGNKLIQGLLVSHTRDGKLIPAKVIEALGDQGKLTTYADELLSDVIATGADWTVTTGLNVTQTAGIAYIAGKRVAVPAVASKTLLANRDTYIYQKNDGTLEYPDSSVGGAAPTAPANSVLSAILTTNATTVIKVQPASRTLQSQDRVILSDSTTAVNNGTYKTYNLTNLIIGATYEAVHQSPGLGQSTNGAGTGGVICLLDGSTPIAIMEIILTGNAFQNPTLNFSGSFVATSTSHSVVFALRANGISLTFSTLNQKTYIKRIVGANGF